MPRYTLFQDDYDYETSEFPNIEEALAHARAGVSAGDYDFGEGQGTLWVRVAAWSVEDGTLLRDTVTLDPPEPRCTKAEHAWASPHSLLGGDPDNPGVTGHGGGAFIREVCRHCGTYRETDTWAQNPETGEEGLRSVCYETADVASREWINDAWLAHLTFTRYTYSNPHTLPVNWARGVGGADFIAAVARAGFDPNDDEVSTGELTRDWNGHRRGALVVSGLLVEGHPFAVEDAGA